MTKRLLFVGLGIVLASASFIASSVAANAAISVFGPGPACPPFYRSLSFGASGTDVTALQTYLNEQGYLSVNPTGYFGPLTQSAVARWQAQGGVVGLGASGSGIFGPLSRGYFLRSCGTTSNPGGGSVPTSTPQSVLNFSATPSSGIAPLTVQFTVSAPQGTTVGNLISFGDGATGTLGFVPVCSSCNLLATASHTYAATGTYTASLMNGACACPAGGVCNCPNIAILATTSVTVETPGSFNSSSTASGIQQLDAPGSVALAIGGIAEIRNANFYFTLANLAGSTATINITPVGCWNSFPSDPTPMIRCMIAVVPTPPQTLSVGQTYALGVHSITLTNITNGIATFSVQ
jgi:peptidoglycan hydrolase-like protein with peptidoglycan-binding domain